MNLMQLLADLPGPVGARLLDRAPVSAPDPAVPHAPEVTAVTHDTRAVTPGALFCCVPGSRADGHDLAPAALDAGAVALLVQRPLTLPERHAGTPQVLVDEVRAALGPVAAAFWGRPSEHLRVVGVTGTAGKTTVTHLLASVLDAAGLPCAVVGTLSGARTTPEAPELQARLAAERDAGRRAVAMEVSSHGLEMHRVDATRFAVAVFTNLSQDHLDFHPSMEEYFRAKARLFDPAFAERAVVCRDDPWGRRLLDEVGEGLDVRPYGIDDAEGLRLGPAGSTFRWRGEPVELHLAGRFNVLNALATAAAAELVGVTPAAVARGLAGARPAPGRFEPVDAGQPFPVLVDYAHKPGALEQVLATARELVEGDGRVVVAFGCGGDRDRAKRPVMGEVAARLADRVVLTSDNPRSEQPRAIISEVQGGMPADAPVVVEPDRRRAIELALDGAGPGDVVVIAGKGHETTQVVGDRTVPFDDREVASGALAARWGPTSDLADDEVEKGVFPSQGRRTGGIGGSPTSWRTGVPET